jgi:hypothetical protein
LTDTTRTLHYVDAFSGFNVQNKENIMTVFLKALLGSSPVGTFNHTRHATVLWKRFLCVREWIVAIQRMRGDVTQQCLGIT